jgi:hypothetical protein
VSADDISERYLKKAIAEINDLGHEIAQSAGSERVPVLGSGHPLADIMLLKHTPQVAELHVVQPKIVVVMGQDSLSCLNAVRFPLATEVEDRMGEIQRFTPTIDALLTPSVDDSLDETKSKRAFWEAFKALGPWWSELPPY